MLVDVLMPALSPEMEEGAIARWWVGPGDRVAAGEVMAEVETDKATVELEAPGDGVVVELLAAAGQANIRVETVVARIDTQT